MKLLKAAKDYLMSFFSSKKDAAVKALVFFVEASDIFKEDVKNFIKTNGVGYIQDQWLKLESYKEEIVSGIINEGPEFVEKYWEKYQAKLVAWLKK